MKKIMKILLSIVLIGFISNSSCMWRRLKDPIDKACSRCHDVAREWYIRALGPHYRDMKLIDGVKCCALFAYEEVQSTSPKTKGAFVALYSIAPYVWIRLALYRRAKFERQCRNSTLPKLLNDRLPEYFERLQTTFDVINECVHQKYMMSPEEQKSYVLGVFVYDDLPLEYRERVIDWRKRWGTYDVKNLQLLNDSLDAQEKSLRKLSEIVRSIIKKEENS